MGIKKIIVILLSTLSIICPSVSFAVFGVGDIVSDPGAYSYYVEQIEVATQKLEALQEQIKKQTAILSVAKEQYEQVIKLKNTLEGAYNYGVRTVAKLRKLQEEIGEDPVSAAMKYGDEYFSDSDAEAWVSAKDVTDFIFQDPRKKDKDLNLAEEQTRQIEILTNKYDMRQKMLESAIDEAEKIYEKLPDRYEAIGDIAAQIDQAETIKQSADINNTINTEILKSITDLTLLVAKLGEAKIALEYEGVDEEISKRIKAELESNEEKIDNYKPFEDYLNKKGINPNNSTRDEAAKIRKKYWE